MGRLLIGGLLMGECLKNPDDLLTLRIDGDGPVGVVLVTATGRGTIKGYVEFPQVELAMNERGFAVAEAIGSGSLTVIKSISGRPPYSGQVELTSSEIGHDIANYFYQSEQIDTIINIGILLTPETSIKQAGGFLIQCLPETPIELIDKLRDNNESFPNLSDFMDMGHSLIDILEKYIFKGIPIKITDSHSVSYKCNCDKQRFLDGIKLLGNDEIQSLIDSDETISAECHFCDKKYDFTRDELTTLLA
jgi:molecular chaperone Hsp33